MALYMINLIHTIQGNLITYLSMIKSSIFPTVYSFIVVRFMCSRQISIIMPRTSKKRVPEVSQSLPIKKTKRSETKGLTRAFYDVSSISLAEKLLGKLLVRKLDDGTILKGRIVETECYPGGSDKGSSTCNGRRTPANEPLYMEPGTTLVYMTYGMYHCMNISSSDSGGGAFIRALEPLEGLDQMRQFRLEKLRSKKEINDKDLCAGPSKLCVSLKIEKAICNKLDLVTSDLLWIEKDPNFKEPIKVVKTTRIGINSAGKEAVEKPFRFYILGNVNVGKIDKIKEDELFDE